MRGVKKKGGLRRDCCRAHTGGDRRLRLGSTPGVEPEKTAPPAGGFLANQAGAINLTSSRTSFNSPPIFPHQPPPGPANMEPPETGDVDLSEIFSMDKIAFNTRNLNYWCGRARARHTPARGPYFAPPRQRSSSSAPTTGRPSSSPTRSRPLAAAESSSPSSRAPRLASWASRASRASLPSL